MKKVVNCRRCKDRDTCQKPCEPLDAQLRREFPLNINVNASPRLPMPPGETSNLSIWKIIEDLSRMGKRHGPTYRERAILILDLAGFDRHEIAKMYGIQHSSVRKIVYAAKKKLLNR